MEILKTAPLLTPFTDDGSSLSEIRIARLVRQLLEYGVGAFAVGTETGEFTTMTISERKQVLEIVLRESGGTPVLTHITTLSTNGTLDLAQHAARHGARAGIMMPPFYGKFHDEEIARHFETTATYANLPLIVVDPMGRLDQELQTFIGNLSQVTLADRIEGQPRLDTDRFHARSWYCSPIFLFSELGLGDRLDLAHDLMAFMDDEHPSAVGKSGLEILGLELGTPRQPRRPLQQGAFQQLRTLLLEPDA